MWQLPIIVLIGQARTLSVFILTAWRAASPLWDILRSGHPGWRAPSPLAVPLCEAFQRDDCFANLIPLLA
jgi:hypothetical protein